MVNPQKKRTVQELKRLVKEYPIVGVVDMQNLPAPQLQIMRRSLRGKVELKMARGRVLHRALEESGDGVKMLTEHLGGMPAMLFTKENPFSLYKTVQKNKSSAPAKPGQIAPRDIIVPAGPTPFAPGPVIGELGALGIKAGVEAGKIVIKQDTVLCKRGEPIKPKAAEMLKRLSIEPMEIGLNIVVVVEKGIVFKAEQLEIDEVKFNAQLMDAIHSARNLAIDVAYPAPEVIEALIQRAFREAKAVALESGFLSKDTIEELLGRGERAAAALQSLVDKK